MALLMMSFGMQELFVGRVGQLPDWLHLRSLEDLKRKLLGIVVVALAVNFFSVALEWTGAQDILAYGLALAVVMAAVGGYSLILARKSAPPQQDAGDPAQP